VLRGDPRFNQCLARLGLAGPEGLGLLAVRRPDL
jgi:hypothetical protein